VNPALLADLVLVCHALIIAFIVFALPLTWLGAWRRWRFVHSPWFRLPHLGLIVFVVVQTWRDDLCPRTVWEAELRRAAGQDGHGPQFIQYWLGELIFVHAPLAVLAWIYSLFGLAVVLTPWWVPVRRR